MYLFTARTFFHNLKKKREKWKWQNSTNSYAHRAHFLSKNYFFKTTMTAPALLALRAV
jgi:hypothetical protein